MHWFQSVFYLSKLSDLDRTTVSLSRTSPAALLKTGNARWSVALRRA